MNILVLVQRRSLIFYYSSGNQPLQCAVPPTVMNDLEILNEQDLHALLGKYVPPSNPKMPAQVLILLNDEVCFSSWITAGKEEEMKKTMIDTIPFSHTEYVTIPLEPRHLFIATNKNLYTTIGRVLESLGCIIISVYPWVITSYSKVMKEGEPFTSAVVDRLFEAQSHVKEFSFSYINAQTPAGSEVQEIHVPVKKSMPTWLIVFLSVSVVYAIGMVFLLLRK